MGTKHSIARAGVWLAVLGGHLLLGLLLDRAGVWRDRNGDSGAAQPPPLVVRLLLPTPRAALAPVPLPSAGRAGRAVRVDAALAVPQAAALPPAAPPAPRAEVMPLTQAAAPTTAAAPAPAPLLLDLPRAASAAERWRNPALDDPRANTAAPTLEARIARAVGQDRLTEEPLGDGRVRFRKGSDCVEVRPNTAGQLDPFNQAVFRLPGLAKPC